nr:12878_t:CDS:1 [Entrophospora candida]
MALELYIPFTLTKVQTFCGFILSFLGIGWFFFLSSVIRYNASRQIRKTNSVPVLETILPLNVIDVFNLLRIKRTLLTVVTCLLVTLGIALTQFDSMIVVNTIGYVESCKTTVETTRVQITTEDFQVAVASYAETDAMVQKRNKSGVPSGVLVGHIPYGSSWKFDAEYDVDPYPWRSSCSIYASGTTNVNMNTSISFFELYQNSDLRKLLPEVHTNYVFGNSPYGYNHTRRNFRTYVHFNRTGNDPEPTGTGLLTLIIEEFTRGNVSEVGAGVIHRLWTLRVPQEYRLPYHRNNQSMTEIVSVPIVVKAHTCEVTRIKVGSQGSVNLLGEIAVALNVAGELIGRKYLTAQIKGTDDTILEYTPEYWASYMEVRDTMTASDSDVPVRVNLGCISIHPVYVFLVLIYIIFIFIGIILLWIIYRNGLEIPASTVSWVIHACKESNLPKEKQFTKAVKQAEFRGLTDDNIRIFYENDEPTVRWSRDFRVYETWEQSKPN